MTLDETVTAAILKVYVSDSIVTVGNGRGFLMETGRIPVVITAAHCLPHLPAINPASLFSESHYPNLLGPLGAPPTIAAECLFVDPIADLAVLGAPNQELLTEDMDYEELIENRPRLSLEYVTEGNRGWLLTLDGNWQGCTAEVVPRGDRMFIDGVPIAGTMGGSPILNANGNAVGVVSRSQAIGASITGPHPVLLVTLPGWLLPADTGPST